MATLIIEIADTKAIDIISSVAKQFGARVKKMNTSNNKDCKMGHTPNAQTEKAIEDAHTGKTTKITDLVTYLKNM